MGDPVVVSGVSGHHIVCGTHSGSVKLFDLRVPRRGRHRVLTAVQQGTFVKELCKHMSYVTSIGVVDDRVQLRGVTAFTFLPGVRRRA